MCGHYKGRVFFVEVKVRQGTNFQTKGKRGCSKPTSSCFGLNFTTQNSQEQLQRGWHWSEKRNCSEKWNNRRVDFPTSIQPFEYDITLVVFSHLEYEWGKNKVGPCGRPVTSQEEKGWGRASWPCWPRAWRRAGRWGSTERFESLWGQPVSLVDLTDFTLWFDSKKVKVVPMFKRKKPLHFYCLILMLGSMKVKCMQNMRF